MRLERLAFADTVRLVTRARIEAPADPLERAVLGLAGTIDLVAATFAPSRGEGRFHRAGGPGVWYGCGRLEPAIAEVAFHQRRRLQASSLPGAAVRLVELRASAAGIFADLRRESSPALDSDISIGWPAGQKLADEARTAACEGIVWPSVRDPAGGDALAILRPEGVRSPRPGKAWLLRIDVSAERADLTEDDPVANP